MKLHVLYARKKIVYFGLCFVFACLTLQLTALERDIKNKANEKYSTYQTYILDKLLETSEEFHAIQLPLEKELIQKQLKNPNNLFKSEEVAAILNGTFFHQKYIPSEALKLVIEYCEDLFITGFVYKTHIFTLLLPNSKLTDKPAYTPLIRIDPSFPGFITMNPKKFKKYALTEMGFSETETEKIELYNLDYSTTKEIVWVYLLSYDHLTGKDYNFTKIPKIKNKDKGPDNTMILTEGNTRLFSVDVNRSDSLREFAADHNISLDKEFICNKCKSLIPGNIAIKKLACPGFNKGCKNMVLNVVAVDRAIIKPLKAPFEGPSLHRTIPKSSTFNFLHSAFNFFLYITPFVGVIFLFYRTPTLPSRKS